MSAAEAEAPIVHRRQRYGVLLAVLLIAFSLQGVATPGAFEQVLISVLLGTTLLASLWVAESKPWVVRTALLIVVALVIVSLIEATSGDIEQAATRIANALLVGIAPIAIVIGVRRNLITRETVTIEAVFGVLCVYILLGMFFSFLYGSIDRLGGSPFFAGGQSASIAHCMYYSFTTLTTTGYGDFTARTNLGHTLSVTEGLIGQIYLVTIVSLIVANLGRRHEPRIREPPGPAA